MPGATHVCIARRSPRPDDDLFPEAPLSASPPALQSGLSSTKPKRRGVLRAERVLTEMAGAGESVEPDWSGRNVSHYEVTARLGAGGMGVVYRARDTRLGREVALKFLHHASGRSPKATERFQREASAVSG